MVAFERNEAVGVQCGKARMRKDVGSTATRPPAETMSLPPGRRKRDKEQPQTHAGAHFVRGFLGNNVSFVSIQVSFTFAENDGARGDNSDFIP